MYKSHYTILIFFLYSEKIDQEYYPRGAGVGGYSIFQATGMIKWEQKSKPKKIPRASNRTPKKSHDEFPSNKNLQKELNDITQKIGTLALNIPNNPI